MNIGGRCALCQDRADGDFVRGRQCEKKSGYNDPEAYVVKSDVRVYDLRERRPKVQKALRILAAVVAMIALLLPGISPLVEAASAAGLPPCCNSVYCPLHHRQMSGEKKGNGLCGSMGTPGERECSMRSCGGVASPVLGTVLFELVTPISLRSPAAAEATPALAVQHFQSVTSIPLTPPPQFLLS
jgi:hypothetical protein